MNRSRSSQNSSNTSNNTNSNTNSNTNTDTNTNTTTTTAAQLSAALAFLQRWASGDPSLLPLFQTEQTTASSSSTSTSSTTASSTSTSTSSTSTSTSTSTSISNPFSFISNTSSFVLPNSIVPSHAIFGRQLFRPNLNLVESSAIPLEFILCDYGTGKPLDDSLHLRKYPPDTELRDIIHEISQELIREQTLTKRDKSLSLSMDHCRLWIQFKYIKQLYVSSQKHIQYTLMDIEKNSSKKENRWCEVPDDMLGMSVQELVQKCPLLLTEKNDSNKPCIMVEFRILECDINANPKWFAEQFDNYKQLSSSSSSSSIVHQWPTTLAYIRANQHKNKNQHYQIGDIIDALDFQPQWCEALVRGVGTDNQRGKLLLHYIGWPEKYDIWLDMNNYGHMLAPRGTHTKGPTRPTLPTRYVFFKSSEIARFNLGMADYGSANGAKPELPNSLALVLPASDYEYMQENNREEAQRHLEKQGMTMAPYLFFRLISAYIASYDLEQRWDVHLDKLIFQFAQDLLRMVCISFMYCDIRTGNPLPDTLHTRLIDPSKRLFTVQTEIGTDLLSKKGKIGNDFYLNPRDYIHFWARFNQIKKIYPCNRVSLNAIETHEKNSGQDSKRFVEIPDDYMYLRVEDLPHMGDGFFFPSTPDINNCILIETRVLASDRLRFAEEQERLIREKYGVANNSGDGNNTSVDSIQCPVWPRIKRGESWKNYQIGDVLDILDFQPGWYEAIIRGFDKEGRLCIHYIGWQNKWDIWLEPFEFARIARRATNTRQPTRNRYVENYFTQIDP